MLTMAPLPRERGQDGPDPDGSGSRSQVSAATSRSRLSADSSDEDAGSAPEQADLEAALITDLLRQAERQALGGGERAALLAAAAAGDRGAEARVVASQLGRLVHLAADRSGAVLGLHELIQEGSIGLIAAVRGFAGSGAADFDVHAGTLIAGEMDAALDREKSAVQEARQAVEDAKAYERIELALAGDLKRRPTPAEIAARLEWPPQRAAAVAEMVANARRLHDEELLRYIDPDTVDVYDLLPGSGPDRN